MITNKSKVLDITKKNFNSKKQHLFDCIIKGIQPKVTSFIDEKKTKVVKLKDSLKKKEDELSSIKGELENYNNRINKNIQIRKRLKKISNMISANVIQENSKYEISVLIRSIENTDLRRVDKILLSFLR